MALSFPKLSKSAWPRLVAPMLLASLGLHGLLLLLPLGQQQEGAIAAADLEEDSIAITRVAPSSPAPGPGAQGIGGAATVPPPNSGCGYLDLQGTPRDQGTAVGRTGISLCPSDYCPVVSSQG